MRVSTGCLLCVTLASTMEFEKKVGRKNKETDTNIIMSRLCADNSVIALVPDGYRILSY
jgi:hypothetical protein